MCDPPLQIRWRCQSGIHADRANRAAGFALVAGAAAFATVQHRDLAPGLRLKGKQVEVTGRDAAPAA